MPSVDMFTGLIQCVGTVTGVETTPRRHGGGVVAHRLEIDLRHLADGLETGASVAINGVCLTVTEQRGSIATFDVVTETWKRTALRELQPGDAVNLEPALRVGDPMDGHFVQGHVDGVGRVDGIDHTAGEWKLWVRAEATLMPAIVPKGSIALDGVSLTVVDVVENRFSVALVPTTLQRTTLGRRQAGDAVNIETDILAKLVMRQVAALAGGTGPPVTAAGLTWDKLHEGGYL